MEAFSFSRRYTDADAVRWPVEPTARLTPMKHFRLYFKAAVAHVIAQAAQSFPSLDAFFEQFPFLEAYYGDLVGMGAEDDTSADWQARIEAAERVDHYLPLAALAAAGELDHDALTLLLCVGLIEEDPRFGLLFEAVQPVAGEHRPTVGLLSAWWRDPEGWTGVRSRIRRLLDLGLVHVANPEAPRNEWALQVQDVLWDVLSGDRPSHSAPFGRPDRVALAPGLSYIPPESLTPLNDLILPEQQRRLLTDVTRLFGREGAASLSQGPALMVRGPQRNCRRTALGAVAASMGHGLLELTGLERAEDPRLRILGPLATMLAAMPVVVLDLAPGQALDLPLPSAYQGPLGIVLGKQGGVTGFAVEHVISLTLSMPDLESRRRHWQAALRPSLASRPAPSAQSAGSNGNGHHPRAVEPDAPAIEQLAAQFRMTGGNIRRAAHLAQTYAELDGHSTVNPSDVQKAVRMLHRETLDALATLLPPLDPEGDAAPGSPGRLYGWAHLAANEEALEELHDLESRCRHRERLRDAVGPNLAGQLNTGVRALFSGPSGTGKTLAARALASVLQMDLYRLDLAGVVNKYIGETEKNLNQVLSRAEELDVVLLLDEGDALLTQRTSVTNSNDRYANLETNFLLQRIESYEGILIVTTNAGERIDSAFQRRMDVVVQFRAPEPAEREAIWKLHLPANHAVTPAFLAEVAQRCALTGGQIRNAALHAALLSFRDDPGVSTSASAKPNGLLSDRHLLQALRREYRKIGAVCPIRIPPEADLASRPSP